MLKWYLLESEFATVAYAFAIVSTHAAVNRSRGKMMMIIRKLMKNNIIRAMVSQILKILLDMEVNLVMVVSPLDMEVNLVMVVSPLDMGVNLVMAVSLTEDSQLDKEFSQEHTVRQDTVKLNNNNLSAIAMLDM